MAARPGDQRPPRGERAVEARARAAVEAVLGDALEALRIVAILASPAIPATAQAIWERIGLPGAVVDQRVPADVAWGGYPGGPAPVRPNGRRPLFPRIDGVTTVPVAPGSTRTATSPGAEAADRRRRGRGGGRRDDDHRRLRPGVVAGGARAGEPLPGGPRDRRAAPPRGEARRRHRSPICSTAPRVRPVAVGECGLDFHYDHSPRDDQRAAFAAADRARPPPRPAARHPHPGGVGRDVRDPRRRRRPGAHRSSTASPAGPTRRARCLDRGAYVSFSGIVTFPGAAGRSRCRRRSCPLARTLVETDSPYLAPVPNRGRRNRPAWVPLVGACLAEIHGLTVEEVRDATAAAAADGFGLALSGTEFLAFSASLGRCPVGRPSAQELTVRLDRADRRRLAFASALTVAALPAVWLVNRDDARSSATRPNVAAVGLAAEDASADSRRRAADQRRPDGRRRPAVRRRATGRAGARGAAPWRSAAPTKSSRRRSRRTADRSARRRLPVQRPARRYCGEGPQPRQRTVDRVRHQPRATASELVLHPDRFVLLAGLSAAPVPVEIHQ